MPKPKNLRDSPIDSSFDNHKKSHNNSIDNPRKTRDNSINKHKKSNDSIKHAYSIDIYKKSRDSSIDNSQNDFRKTNNNPKKIDSNSFRKTHNKSIDDRTYNSKSNTRNNVSFKSAKRYSNNYSQDDIPPEFT